MTISSTNVVALVKKANMILLAIVAVFLLFVFISPATQVRAQVQECTQDPCAEDTSPFNPVSPDVCTGPRASSTLCQANVDQGPRSDNRLYGPSGVLTTAANLLSLVVGIASVIMIIVGGFQYVLSAGDSSKISTAKNTILYALIGLVIAASARLIIVFVLERIE